MHPILFHLGSQPVYAFGTMLAIGFFVSYLYVRWRCEAIGVSDENVLNLFILLVVTGVVGSRLLAVAIDLEHYPDLMSVLRVSNGGLAFHGGLALALASGVAYLKVYRLPILPVLDRFGPAVPLAHACGRVGCFLYGCCYGVECSLPWAMRMPPPGADGTWPYRHPTQLYEFFLLLLLVGILHVAIDRPHRPGMVMVSYFYGYPLIRFPLEFIRADNHIEPHYWGLSVAQVACIGMVGLGALAQWLLSRPARAAPAAGGA